MPHSKLTKPRILTLVAGSLDFTTGLGLVFAPAFTLRLMFITDPIGPEALIYLRFVGAFVAAVGITYLLALQRGDAARLRSCFEFTLPFRIFAGLFTTAALALGWLTPPWISVPIADFALVALQLVFLRTSFTTKP